jgi:hypothetical protein
MQCLGESRGLRGRQTRRLVAVEGDDSAVLDLEANQHGVNVGLFRA